MKYVPHDYQAYAAQFILDHPVEAIHPASCGQGLNLRAGGEKLSHRRRGMNAYEYLSQAYMLEQRIRTKLQYMGNGDHRIREQREMRGKAGKSLPFLVPVW